MNWTPIRPGDLVSSEVANRLADLIQRATLKIGSGLVGKFGPGGSAIAVSRTAPRWAKITGGGNGGVYQVLEQDPSGPGEWENGTAFEAREPNGLASLRPGVIVLCTYGAASDEWLFDNVSCPGS